MKCIYIDNKKLKEIMRLFKSLVCWKRRTPWTSWK